MARRRAQADPDEARRRAVRRVHAVVRAAYPEAEYSVAGDWCGWCGPQWQDAQALYERLLDEAGAA